MLANGMKRASSALGHFKRVSSAPRFDSSGDNEEFFASFKKAEQEFNKSRSSDTRTLGLKRAGFVGSNAVTSGFTLPKTAKASSSSPISLDSPSPPKPLKRPRESEPASSPPQKKIRTTDFVQGSKLNSLFGSVRTAPPRKVFDITDSPVKKPEKNSTIVPPIEIDPDS